MEEQLGKISQKIEEISNVMNDFTGKLSDRDQVIKSKDQRIAELTDKLVNVSKEKDDALWAKIQLMKEISAEREQISKEMTQLREDLGVQEDKIKKLKTKQRQAQDGLIGSSFEVDRMKKEVEEKAKEIEDIREKAQSVSMGSTGILYDFSTAIEYLKDRIQNSNRSLRLVVPSMDFLEEFNVFEVLDQLPESCVVNIASALDLGQHQEIVDNWKERGWYVTNYQGRNFFMISANGADVCVAYTTEGQISGFYSNIAELVTIFNQALMYPFIKGQKL